MPNNHTAARFAFAVAAALTATVAAPAQLPQGNPAPADVTLLDAVPAAGSPAAVRWDAARQALERNDRAAAMAALRDALEFHPASPPLLFDAVRAAATPDERWLWLQRWARAAADAQGRLKPDPEQRRTATADELKQLQVLTTARCQAAAELVRAAGKVQPTGKQVLGNGATARALLELALAVMHETPALLRQHGPELIALESRFAPDHERIFAALAEVMSSSTPPPVAADGKSDPEQMAAWQRAQDRAIAAARVIIGLASQASQHDLVGPPPPPLGDLPQRAREQLARLRDTTIGVLGTVYSIEQLQQFDQAQRDAFTLAHRTWSNPGIALSPNGRYRIETTCGFHTLLGAAQTIEAHHARLVSHYGQDPFVERQGTIRIVPEQADMGGEGTPRWWAAGFQAGDLTVARFTWGTIPGLGHLLVHELTHRFDGVLRPFLPSWYGEGHANWTSASYGRLDDKTFVDDRMDIGAASTSFYKGYAGAESFAKLLAGTIEEYRDNYPVGQSLYTFLHTWPPDAPKYREALRRYEQNARAGIKDPVGYFTKVFCDGKDGRPKDLDGLREEWTAFIGGAYRVASGEEIKPEDEWIERYRHQLPGDTGEVVKQVADEPTWSWDRHNAEPFFGSGHATIAGELLAEAGMPGPAAAALLWSLQVDGWQRPVVERAIACLEQAGRTEPAIALESLARQRFVIGKARALPGALPRTKAYLDALGAAAAQAEAAGLPATALELRFEQRQLQTRLGLTDVADAMSAGGLPHALGLLGWVEDSLTGYDERRVRDLWFPTETGDLHVGRSKPRDATGLTDRASHQRQTFVRTAEWQSPGDYRIKMRVQFTTSFVSGAVVLGHWRRDRDIRLSFSAGDFKYAIGKSEQNRDFRQVNLHLRGLWERDRNHDLPSTEPSDALEFDPPSSWFDLELHVRGPSVQVIANGTPMFRYTTHDGAPIEGFVGFAMGQGAIRVQQPVVQRLDGTRPGGATSALCAIGLDPLTASPRALDDLLYLPTRNLATTDVGSLVLWIPRPEPGDEPGQTLGRFLPYLAALLNDPIQYPQRWQFAVPADIGDTALARLQHMLADMHPTPMPVIRHQVAVPFTGDPWVLFVDAHGILRAAAEVSEPRFHGHVQKWARMFRAR